MLIRWRKPCSLGAVTRHMWTMYTMENLLEKHQKGPFDFSLASAWHFSNKFDICVEQTKNISESSNWQVFCASKVKNG